MRFIDPYVLLNLQVAGPSEITDAMLQAAQKQFNDQIQAVLGNSSAGIAVQGRYISYSDATALSKAMDDPQARQHFWNMRQVGGMMAFLENGVARDLQPLLARSVAVGPDFHAFASKWIARTVDEQMRGALAGKQWPVALTLARGMAQLHPLAQSAALVEAEAYFESLRQNLEIRKHEPRIKLTEIDLRQFCLSPMIGVLNNLPANAQAMRDAYVGTLCEAISATALAHRDEPWTFALAQTVSQIKVSDSMRITVQNMVAQVRDYSGIAAYEAQIERNKRNAAYGGGILVIGFIILRLILIILRHSH